MERKKDRNAAIAAARADGLSLAQIANAFGISITRVSQILKHEDVFERRENTDLWVKLEVMATKLGYSRYTLARAYNIVKKYPGFSIDEIVAVRGCGEKTERLLRAAM